MVGSPCAGKPVAAVGRIQPLRPTRSLPFAAGRPVSEPIALKARPAVPWRTVVAATSLSLLLVLALSQLSARRHPHAHAQRATRSHPPPRLALSMLPLAAQGVASETLGADDRAYRVGVSRGGLRAVNPAQRLWAHFGRAGPLVSTGTARMGLSLRAVGFGDSLRALGGVAPRVRANRVVYARGGVSEWYANGPLGLEQGLTIARTSTGHPNGPLTLSMALSGNVRASLAAGGQSVMFRHAGGSFLRYGGLVAMGQSGTSRGGSLTRRSMRILVCRGVVERLCITTPRMTLLL